MSTLKSSAENLTLNADGANNDIIFQSNGSTKVTLDGQNTRLGIGTATPTQSLDVIGNIDFGANSNGFIEEDGAVVRYKNTGTGTTHLMSHDGNEDITLDASGFIQFEAAGTVEARIDADGLKFGTDTAAANALDDYEEGTWTPTLISANEDATVSGGSYYGRYVKIGRQVTITFWIVSVTVGAEGTGNARIGGIPFTPPTASFNQFGSIHHVGGGFTTAPNAVYSRNNQALLQLVEDTGGQTTLGTGSANYVLGGTFVYQITA